LRDGELALLHPAIDRWLHRFKNVAPISSPSCNHAFTVNVVNDKGFCETIVELVSELVKDLDLDNYGWFYTRFNLKQLTYVRVGEEWVDFERHILSKYPVEKK
jgi:hypothetical protein